MTPRSLFKVILKVIGIFLLKDFLLDLPPLLSLLPTYSQGGERESVAWVSALVMLTIFVQGVAAVLLIFKTTRVVDWLRLDKGFTEESFSFQLHRSTVLAIAVIVMGGFIVVDEIPPFCRQLILYFNEPRFTHGSNVHTLRGALVSGISIFIGFALMVYQRKIVNLVERLRKN